MFVFLLLRTENGSTGLLIFRHRSAERFEQCAIDRAALRLVFGMPLHAERKARRIGDADRLDRVVLGYAFDDDALARLENALAVQRIDADALGAQQFGEDAAWREPDLVPLGENHFQI